MLSRTWRIFRFQSATWFLFDNNAEGALRPGKGAVSSQKFTPLIYARLPQKAIMDRKTIEFSIQEAGCLLYAADLNLGGNPFAVLDNRRWKPLTEKGALMATSLYQDDGFYVRVVFGDLTAEEQSEWTSRVRWKLNLESGKMVVSGVCDPDIEEYLEDFPVAETGGDYHLGCRVPVPQGEYSVTIYSYPPNDLAGGWMAIEDRREFKLCFGQESEFGYEKPVDYWTRTHPGEPAPDWVKDGCEDTGFLDFVIQFTSLSESLPLPEFEADGCLLWQYRKPPICPVGIRLESPSRL